MAAQQNPDDAWRWTVADGLGSVRGVVDAVNVPLESRVYTPYGEVFGTSGTNQTVFGFTGEPTDSNGLVHLRARYYNPTLGVFPSLDPLEGEVGNPLSLHRYAYVQGNPVNLTDPSGLDPVDATAALVACLATPGCGEILAVAGLTIAAAGVLYLNRDSISKVGEEIIRGFSRIGSDLGRIHAQQMAYMAATNSMLARTIKCTQTAPPNRPSECQGTIVRPGELSPQIEHAIEEALSDSVRRIIRRWFDNLTDPSNGTGPDGGISPRPIPAKTPNPTLTTTPLTPCGSPTYMPTATATEQKDALLHYTDLAGFAEISSSRLIRANTKNIIYATRMRVNEETAFYAFFAANPAYKGKGSHIVEFTYRDHIKWYSAGQDPAATQPNELVHYGTLREPSDITIMYIGTNPF